MRPSDIFLGRVPHTADNGGPPAGLNSGASVPHMSFFFGDEAALEAASQQQHSAVQHNPTHGQHQQARARKSQAEAGPAGGISSLENLTTATSHCADVQPRAGDGVKDNASRRSIFKEICREHALKGPREAEGDDDEVGPLEANLRGPTSRPSTSSGPNLVQHPPSILNSLPMTPVLLGMSGPASSVALSSCSSRRNSLAESLLEDPDLLAASQPVSVDGEQVSEVSKEARQQEHSINQSIVDSDNVPHLIMPSIRMPSRRPFTEEGKRLGRLKVLVAGDTGVGKTSLLKAVLQTCEHIVHVDRIAGAPLSASGLSSPTGQRAGSGRSTGLALSSTGSGLSSMEEMGTRQITEIYASTKPYPGWWSEMDDLCVLQRRKSLGDTVLDRNVCFVDTPGYGSGLSSMDTITAVVQYVEEHLQRMSTNALTDGDILNLVGGGGGVQVDAVFYMVSNRLRPVDIRYLRQLASLTNIIIILAQVDLMSTEQVAASKEQIHSVLEEAGVQPFAFSLVNTSRETIGRGIYATSSATASDHDIMDASLLMSPDYLQPLIRTELLDLVSQVLNPDGASWLRHSAAKKYLQWRKAKSPETSTSRRTNVHISGALNSSQPSSHHILTSSMGPASTYALARVSDHTQREEHLARIRLANWATDLQRSLANERAQLTSLARSERAVWLTEKLNECVQDGSLVPRNGRRNLARSHRHTHERLARRVAMADQSVHRQYRDPLGFLKMTADLRRSGLLVLEVLGGLGMIGGLALLMSRHAQACEWIAGEWERLWGGGWAVIMGRFA